MPRRRPRSTLITGALVPDEHFEGGRERENRLILATSFAATTLASMASHCSVRLGSPPIDPTGEKRRAHHDSAHRPCSLSLPESVKPSRRRRGPAALRCQDPLAQSTVSCSSATAFRSPSRMPFSCSSAASPTLAPGDLSS